MKKGIELMLLTLEQNNIDQSRIDALVAYLNDHKEYGKAAELVNTISDIEPLINGECIRMLDQIEQLMKEEDPLYKRAHDIKSRVRMSIKLKLLEDEEIVLLPDSLIEVEEAMTDNKLLSDEMVLSKKHFNPNKKIAVGLIWRMIEHGFFEYDKEKPIESEKAIVTYLKGRWHIDDLQEFKHKKNKEAYCKLADRIYGVYFLENRKKK